MDGMISSSVLKVVSSGLKDADQLFIMAPTLSLRVFVLAFVTLVIVLVFKRRLGEDWNAQVGCIYILI